MQYRFGNDTKNLKKASLCWTGVSKLVIVMCQCTNYDKLLMNPRAKHLCVVFCTI